MNCRFSSSKMRFMRRSYEYKKNCFIGRMYCIGEDDIRYLVISLCDINFDDEIFLADDIDYFSRPWRWGRPCEHTFEYKIRLEYLKRRKQVDANYDEGDDDDDDIDDFGNVVRVHYQNRIGGINDSTGKNNESESSNIDSSI